MQIYTKIYIYKNLYIRYCIPGRALPMKEDGHNVTGPVPAMNVEKGRWHRLEALETGTVIVEFKNGPYEPIGAEDVMEG